MARPKRKSDPTLKDALFEEPYTFEFHQAIKLLEQLYPDAVPFGEGEEPLDEVVDVKSRVFFEALASDIFSLDPTGKAAYLPSHQDKMARSDEPIQMQVNFMGLAGIQGPLPYAYAEMIIQRLRSGDTTLRDFLDIFNHRLISILHRIRKQYTLSLNAVTPDKTPQANAMRALIGIDGKHLQDRLAVPDRGLLQFTSLFWQRPRSAQGLKQVLEQYFNIPVRIEECVGCWRSIEKEDYTHLGDAHLLGQGAVLGKRVWDQESRFIVHIGPLNSEELQDFLPDGKAFAALKDLITLYADPMMDFEINYVVKSSDVPESYLNKGMRLGWRSWLHGKDNSKKAPDEQVNVI